MNKRMGLAVAVLLAGVVFSAGFLFSGVYNVGADEPHWSITARLLETLRERSIAVRARGLVIPALDEPGHVERGAKHYAGMCSGCHLAPGVQGSDLRDGLYPRPPNLAKHDHGHHPAESAASAARQFWIIKHGLKTTGMPAWGVTHDDEAIWDIVAFLQALPNLAPAAYSRLTGSPGQPAEGRSHDHDGPDEPSRRRNADRTSSGRFDGDRAPTAAATQPTTEPDGDHDDDTGSGPDAH